MRLNEERKSEIVIQKERWLNRQWKRSHLYTLFVVQRAHWVYYTSFVNIEIIWFIIHLLLNIEIIVFYTSFVYIELIGFIIHCLCTLKSFGLLYIFCVH